MSGIQSSSSGMVRFRRGHPCPICGGSDDDPRGEDRRCFGFLSGDGEYAHCTRQGGGDATFNHRSSTWAHKLKGKCKCGEEHTPDFSSPAATGRRGRNDWLEGATLEAEFIYEDLVDGVRKPVRKVSRFRDAKGRKKILQAIPTTRKNGEIRWAWGTGNTTPILYRRTELLALPRGSIVFVAEGEPKVDAIRAAGFNATCNAMGAGKWADHYSTDLAGQHVVVLPDNDDAGREHGLDVARSTHRHAASVKYVELHGLPPKGDIIDWIKAGRTVREMVAIAAETPAWSPLKVVPHGLGQGSADLPIIICGSEDQTEGLKRWTPQALEALRERNRPTPRVFESAGRLARIKPAQPDEPPSIDLLTTDGLRGELDRAAIWGNEQFTKSGKIRVAYGPPRLDVVRDIMALASWDRESIPRLDAVVETPRFLSDGRLLRTPGYHAAGCLFYAPAPGMEAIEIPERPTVEDIAAAKSLLLDDLLIDFMFANQASRAAALAYMLLPFVRSLILGPTPLHHFGATTEGTGKTLAAICCAYPALGREMTHSTQKENEAEWRKALTSMLLSGLSHFCIDNLNNPLAYDGSPSPIDSGTLAMALTSPYYNDRRLGGNEEARIRVQTIWASTGNNTVFSRELTRRVVPIDLTAPVENPSLRTGFKHDPIIEMFVEPRRLDLLRACLVICQHWIAEGRPQGSQTMGRFESYSRVMGGILGSIGVDGFLANRTKMMGRNPEATRWAALVEAWHQGRGEGVVASSDLFDIIRASTDLNVAFVDILGDRNELSQKQRFGKAIEKQAGQVWGDWRITRTAAKARNGCATYRLRPASVPYQVDETDEKEDEPNHATHCSEADWTLNR